MLGEIKDNGPADFGSRAAGVKLGDRLTIDGKEVEL